MIHPLYAFHILWCMLVFAAYRNGLGGAHLGCQKLQSLYMPDMGFQAPLAASPDLQTRLTHHLHWPFLRH